MNIQVWRLDHASKQVDSEKAGTSFTCGRVSIIFWTHFEPQCCPVLAIRKGDSKLNNISWISRMDIRKSKELIIKEFDLFRNHRGISKIFVSGIQLAEEVWFVQFDHFIRNHRGISRIFVSGIQLAEEIWFVEFDHFILKFPIKMKYFRLQKGFVWIPVWIHYWTSLWKKQLLKMMIMNVEIWIFHQIASLELLSMQFP